MLMRSTEPEMAAVSSQIGTLSGVSNPNSGRSPEMKPPTGKGGRGPKALGPLSFPKVLAGAPDLIVPMVVLGIVLAMIVPLPAFLLDLLISMNITVSVIVLLVSMYITRPVEFTVFPTTLLLLTL